MWDDLTTEQRANWKAFFARQGVYKESLVKKHYQEYQDYLSKMELVAELNYKDWGYNNPNEALVHALNDNTYNYQGFYRDNPNSNANALTHWPDTYKTVYRPTFSNESKYSGIVDRNYNPEGRVGGYWNNDDFVSADWQNKKLTGGRLKQGTSSSKLVSNPDIEALLQQKYGFEPVVDNTNIVQQQVFTPQEKAYAAALQAFYERHKTTKAEKKALLDANNAVKAQKAAEFGTLDTPLSTNLLYAWRRFNNAKGSELLYPLPIIGTGVFGVDVADKAYSGDYGSAIGDLALYGAMTYFPEIVNGLKIKNPNATKKVLFKSELDWSPKSWFGDYAKRYKNPETKRGKLWTKFDERRLKQHTKEYLDIEKSSKEDGTWLKMPDGSIYRGDPREWVMMLSKAFNGLEYKNGFRSGIGEKYIPTLSDYNGKIWLSDDPKVYEAFAKKRGTDFFNRIGSGTDYAIATKKGIKVNKFNANGHSNESIDGNYDVPFTTDDFIEQSIKEGYDASLIDNIYEMLGLVGDNPSNDFIIHQGTPRKIITGNNGDFNLLNSNNFRTLIPIVPVLGSGYYLYNNYGKGGSIHIKHPGRLTALKKRTGKTEAELWRTGSKAVRKMITFARNARKFKHLDGGYLDDIIWDNMGLWSHPGQITGIIGTKDGTYITMNGVADYLIGKDNLGNVKFMKPGRNYHFPGSSVVEYPIRRLQDGGYSNKLNKLNWRMHHSAGSDNIGSVWYNYTFDPENNYYNGTHYVGQNLLGKTQELLPYGRDHVNLYTYGDETGFERINDAAPITVNGETYDYRLYYGNILPFDTIYLKPESQPVIDSMIQHKNLLGVNTDYFIMDLNDAEIYPKQYKNVFGHKNIKRNIPLDDTRAVSISPKKDENGYYLDAFDVIDYKKTTGLAGNRLDRIVEKENILNGPYILRQRVPVVFDKSKESNGPLLNLISQYKDNGMTWEEYLMKYSPSYNRTYGRHNLDAVNIEHKRQYGGLIKPFSYSRIPEVRFDDGGYAYIK